MKSIYSLYSSLIKFHQFVFDELADKRTNDLFLVSSPYPVIGILIAYVYFAKYFGPRLMLYREPFKLEMIMIFYNIIQIIANAVLFCEAFRLAWGGTFNWICEPHDDSTTPRVIYITRVCYFYFLLKLSDLLDTVFMVLRKSPKYISFLHVYHHAGMCAMVWGGVKYLPGGGHGSLIGFINSFVHTVMYTYYLVTAIWPQYKDKIWWKKYLTQLQMVQFLIIAVHTSLLFFQPNCNYPKFVIFVLVPQNIFMFFLFLDFYKKAYLKSNNNDKIITSNKGHNNIANNVKNEKVH